jgi:hypothetical protein
MEIEIKKALKVLEHLKNGKGLMVSLHNEKLKPCKFGKALHFDESLNQEFERIKKEKNNKF